MAKVIKISEALATVAALFAKIEHRSVAGQVEYWAKLGKIGEENPVLPISFIRINPNLSKEFSSRGYYILIMKSGVTSSSMNLLSFFMEPVNKNNYYGTVSEWGRMSLIVVLVCGQQRATA